MRFPQGVSFQSNCWIPDFGKGEILEILDVGGGEFLDIVMQESKGDPGVKDRPVCGTASAGIVPYFIHE